MKTLAILSQKGGTGKTNTAVNLAVASQLAGHPTALIDLDPQASAAKWGDRREGNTPDVSLPTPVDSKKRSMPRSGAERSSPSLIPPLLRTRRS